MKKAATLFAVAFVCALCFALAGCGSSGASSSASPSASEASASAASAAASAEAASSSSAEASASATASADAVTAAELASVGVSIEYGDYDGMAALSKEIQNGERDDQVVEVDGVVSNFARGMTYNIMEPSADGAEKIGTMFVIAGVEGQAEEDVYPADETHVKIVGKVGIDPDGIYYLIYTLPEFIEVLD